VRRASINCFGFGGSNAHAIVDQPSKAARGNYMSSYRIDGEEEEEYDDGTTETQSPPQSRPYTLVLSANDAAALNANVLALCNHVANLSADAPVADLAYTLSERRSQLWHRAFVTSHTTNTLDESDFVLGKKLAHTPKFGLVFTGQGAQWPQMGKDLLVTFPRLGRCFRSSMPCCRPSRTHRRGHSRPNSASHARTTTSASQSSRNH